MVAQVRVDLARHIVIDAAQEKPPCVRNVNWTFESRDLGSGGSKPFDNLAKYQRGRVMSTVLENRVVSWIGKRFRVPTLVG